MVANRAVRGDVTKAEKHQVLQFILQKSICGVPKRNTMKAAVSNFKLGTRTIARIWSEAKPQLQRGEAVEFQRGKLGKIHKDKMQLDVERVKTLSVLERSTIRKMASKLEVSKSAIGRFIQNKELRAHTNAIKPKLTEANKLARLKFSLSQVNIEQGVQNKLKYQDMQNIIHIDEKWFYMTKTSDRYYLLPDEIEPHRSCQSKRFITKVMFMAAVARPLYDTDGSVKFDGKIRLFPFTMEQAARRNSKNRAKGTLETKAMDSITKDVIKDCLINKIIPAIKAKWPRGASKTLIIQQDNAKPHISCNDADFMEAANSDGFNMQLICQPPNSPDLNVNDLDFFRSIACLQDDKPCKNVDELLQNVHSSFEALTAYTLNNVFLTLQTCFTETMQLKGDNNYKIPHMNKERLFRLGILPHCIEVQEELVRECLDYLELPDNQTGDNYNICTLMTHLGYA